MSPNCPCGLPYSFDDCCGRFISGKASAPTAEALMRSRYSAYATGAYQYIHDTYHSTTRNAISLAQISLNASDTLWLGLQILHTHLGSLEDSQGIVEFVARFKTQDKLGELHEKSRFLKENDQWRYVNGEMQSDKTNKADKVGRNDPCPCGSGKKYKKCCGSR